MTIPRHLAPTVGPSASAAGVSIRTGLTITTGERVASGLVWRFGSLGCVANALLADRPFLRRQHHQLRRRRLYVATVAPPLPREIVAAQALPLEPAPASPPPALASCRRSWPRRRRRRQVHAHPWPRAGAQQGAAHPPRRAKAPPPPSRWTKLGQGALLHAGADPTTIEGCRRAASSSSSEDGRSGCAKRPWEISQRSSTAPTASRQPATTQVEPARSAREEAAWAQRSPGRRCIAGSVSRATHLQHPDKNMLAGEAAAEELHRLEGAELLHAHGGAAPSRRADSRNTHASSSRPSRPPSGNSGRSRPPSSRHDDEEYEYERPSTIKHRAAPEASGPRQPARSRLGPRVEPADARDRLDRLVESRIAEEEGPAGPKCFGPRILNEPMRAGFQLPRDTPKYDGTTKPEDWLQDYSTAVGIAQGNKRWAVRYSPLMLLGSARTWLNNLPAGSINGWLDFEDAFISNFTGTYRRPGRPQQLEMCKQGADETDRAHGVGFFMAGCRPNTMLAQAHRSDPKTMAALMAIADKRDNNKPAEHKPAEAGHHGSRRDNYRGKRHSDQPDRRYGSAHVAAVSDHAAGASRRQKQTDRPWKPKYTFEQMLDSPCKYHSGKNPSNHSTRDCHFMKRLTSGEPLPPPPPPPPAGGPGGQAGAEANNLEHHEANQVHHGGRYLAEDATYIIFTSEPEDKTSQQRRSLEVNAVMPPVPQYLHWSEQAITFDRRDTPAVLPKPGSYAMVLDPTIGTTRRSVRFSRVLMDGGSSINILYRDTARKLGIQEAELRPTPTVFHGIVPGHCCQPIGRITWRAPRCGATEKQLIHDAVALAKAAQADMPAVGNPAGTTHFQPADNTKKILLDPAQPDKYVTIGAGLSSK
ncbi:hypothetical protein QYE76_057618 [Lolium multiflorum]|uniref:Retrotransposon gag domain-containing protein n=1 Tax=Lolium multiflorum TaxID=4521 RepID=A0AAD8WNZ0_LOLMU|nr:hypothetical protein QYE76_057618 [Lolium multiflorum]